MKLSIIIRSWNRLEYTIRSIVSIDEKSGLNRDEYEIICVDQNSTDGTREWLSATVREGYYHLHPVLLNENVGDGKGMQEGIKLAKGDFIAQHDNDIELVSENYYQNLIDIYECLEKSERVCAIGGQHRQGVNKQSSPWKFGRERYPDFPSMKHKCVSIPVEYFHHLLYPISWVTASFIFRKEFTSVPFAKGMCNQFCSEWWNRGYDNFSCETLKFWHIDSADKGGEYVKKQAEKFLSYEYIRTHYRNFV